MEQEKFKRRAKQIILIAVVCILVFLGVQNLNVVISAATWLISLIFPLLLGLVFAALLNVPMTFFESHFWPKTGRRFLQMIRRPISFLLSLVLILGILAGVIILVIPELVEAVKLIVETAAGYVNKLAAMDSQQFAKLPFGEWLLGLDWNGVVVDLQNWLKEQSGNIMNIAFGTITSLVTGVFQLFIAMVFSGYILFNKEKLKSQLSRLIRAWLPIAKGEWLIHVAAVACNNFRNFVVGQSLEAVILSCLCMAGMLALQIPYVPMVGALVGVTALIPIVGGVIGTVIGTFVILAVDPIKAVIFLAFLIILQQLEGNLIYPRVMGSRVKLPAMWILAAVTLGGGLAGPVGMILGVPIASTAYQLLREATQKREAKLAEKNDLVD